MSEESYQRNLCRGVTGPSTGTCLLASYDRISQKTGISPETYDDYNKLRKEYVDKVGDTNFVPNDLRIKYHHLKEKFRRELGVYTTRNIIEARVNSESALENRLADLIIGGFRTAVYLNPGGLHAVGLLKVDRERYEVKSTWSPFEGTIVSCNDLFGILDRAPRFRKRVNSGRHTIVEPNIVALPSE